MSEKNPRLSVVVPTYQRCHSVRRLLDALCRQSLPAELFEVVVVIDGSTDGTFELVAGFSAPYALQVLRQPRSGRAAACNAGIRRAGGDLIVLLDDDMEPAPRLLAAHMSAQDAHPRLGVLGAVPIRGDASTSAVARFVAVKFDRHLERLATGGEIGFRSFYSGNFSIARSILDEVGLFDPGYREYGNEDTELALRLMAAGVRLRYDSRALAYQHYEKDVEALARDSLAKGRTAVLTARKHPEMLGAFELESFRRASAKWTDRSVKWKLPRAALLAASRFSLAPARALVRLVEWIERYEPSRLNVLYLFVVDVFYWIGISQGAGAEPAQTRRAAAAPPANARATAGGV